MLLAMRLFFLVTAGVIFTFQSSFAQQIKRLPSNLLSQQAHQTLSKFEPSASGGALLLLAHNSGASSQVSRSGAIKYSTPPVCTNNEVICTNPNEIPTCLVLSPKVHIENTTGDNGEKINRYQPYCKNQFDDLMPTCIDLNFELTEATKGVTLECVEFVKCNRDEKLNKVVANCSGGKIPKCLGNDDLPDCEAENVCKNNSVPLCDYIWEASAALNRVH